MQLHYRLKNNGTAARQLHYFDIRRECLHMPLKHISICSSSISGSFLQAMPNIRVTISDNGKETTTASTIERLSSNVSCKRWFFPNIKLQRPIAVEFVSLMKNIHIKL